MASIVDSIFRLCERDFYLGYRGHSQLARFRLNVSNYFDSYDSIVHQYFKQIIVY